MKLKFNTNSTKVNIFVILLFNIYLFGLVLGPGLINIFFVALLYIYIKNFRQNTFFLIDNFNIVIKLQSLFILYLVLNSLFVGYEINLFYKSLFFFRFFLLAFVLSHFLDLKLKTLNYVFLSILIFSIFLGIDIIYQYLTGYDFFGYKPGICLYPTGEQNFDPKNCERFSGFFGDEFIAGGFLSTYGIIALYIFFAKFDNFKFKNYISIIIFLLIISAILLSGERNAVLTIIMIFIINVLFNKKIQKLILTLSLSIIFVFSILFLTVDNTKYRFFYWPINNLNETTGNIIKKVLNTSWGAHYISAYDIFLDNKLFGSGFKSFRIECNKSKYDIEILNKKYKLNNKSNSCSTHPHNFYLEILSELGLVGFILFFLIIYFLVFHQLIKHFKYIRNEGEIIVILSIILAYIFPLRPTGSFSSSVYATNLWFFIGFYLYFIKNLNYKIKNQIIDT